MKNNISTLIVCFAVAAPVWGADEGFSLKAGIGAEYDSNITVSETDITTNKGDAAALIDFGAIYKIKTEQKISLEFGYDFSQSLYANETAFNLQNHALTFNADTQIKDVDLGIAYGFYTIRLGGAKFMDMHTINPNAAIFFGKSSYLRADYTYFKKNFDLADERDADTHSVGATLYQFMDDGSFLNFGLKYEKEDTLSDEFDYSGLVARAGYQKKVSLGGKETKLSFALEYKDRNYANITESIGVKRDDKRVTLTAKATYPIFKDFTLKPQYRFVNATSNLESADYSEHMIGATLGYSF